MTKPLSFLIRCDASLEIGTGHAVRCLTLANALKEQGHKIHFMSNPQALDLVSDLENFYIGHTTSCDVLIVDHYGLDETYEHAAREFAKQIVVIDDLANRPHDCDILIDQNYGRDGSDYKALVPQNCVVLAGADYVLLRPEFFNLKTQAIEKRKSQKSIEHILVFLSGSDKDNVTSKAIEGLKNFNGQVHVVINANSPHFQSLTQKIVGHKNIQIHSGLDAKRMADLMLTADLAIGAGGTTSWERAVLGLPVIMIEIADNQREIAKNLQEAGAAVLLGWHEDVSPDMIAQAVEKIKNSPENLCRYAQNAFKICDGLGTQRVIESIINKTKV